MPQGKWNVYDNDLRIPWVIRGPGIAKNTTFDYVGSQVDTLVVVVVLVVLVVLVLVLVLLVLVVLLLLVVVVVLLLVVVVLLVLQLLILGLDAAQVDTIPTILGLAGVPTPGTMDGRSIAHLLLSGGGEQSEVPAPAAELMASAAGKKANAAPWRTEQLVEYYGLGNVVRYEHRCCALLPMSCVLPAPCYSV